MRYIGVLRSGTNEENSIAVGNQGLDQILVNQDTISYLSGNLMNVGNQTLLVNFYVANRETQNIALHPQQEIDIKNIPCQRLQLRSVGQITICVYSFTQIQAENDKEDRAMLLYSDIKKKLSNSSSSNPIARGIQTKYFPEISPLGLGLKVGDTFPMGRRSDNAQDRRNPDWYYSIVQTGQTPTALTFNQGKFYGLIPSGAGNTVSVIDNIHGANLGTELSPDAQELEWNFWFKLDQLNTNDPTQNNKYLAIFLVNRDGADSVGTQGDGFYMQVVNNQWEFVVRQDNGNEIDIEPLPNLPLLEYFHCQVIYYLQANRIECKIYNQNNQLLYDLNNGYFRSGNMTYYQRFLELSVTADQDPTEFNLYEWSLELR